MKFKEKKKCTHLDQALGDREMERKCPDCHGVCGGVAHIPDLLGFMNQVISSLHISLVTVGPQILSPEL